MEFSCPVYRSRQNYYRFTTRTHLSAPLTYSRAYIIGETVFTWKSPPGPAVLFTPPLCRVRAAHPVLETVLFQQTCRRRDRVWWKNVRRRNPANPVIVKCKETPRVGDVYRMVILSLKPDVSRIFFLRPFKTHRIFGVLKIFNIIKRAKSLVP